MCPTFIGRTETRTAILIGPAIIGAILSLLLDNEGFIVLIGLYYLVGVVLDLVLYPLIIKWQPPWLTFVLGFGEFVLVYVLAQVLEVPLSTVEAVVWYWIAWAMAVVTGIVVLPLVSLSWIENGGEFRRTGWTVPAGSESLPLIAHPDARPVGAHGLLREFSSVNNVPDEVRAVPAPSGVHERPEQFSAARRG
jgi:hypothetical protein